MKNPPKLLPHQQAWLNAHPDRTEEWLRQMIREGFNVHHGDGVHSNNHSDNLFLIEGSDHMRLHGIFGLVWRLTYVRRNPIYPELPEDPEATPQEGEVFIGWNSRHEFERLCYRRYWETGRVEDGEEYERRCYVQLPEYEAYLERRAEITAKRQATIERKKALNAANPVAEYLAVGRSTEARDVSNVVI